MTAVLSLESNSEMIQINLSAESNVTEVDDSDLIISPSEATVMVPEGETGTVEFTAENTGELDMTDILVELENSQIDIDSFDLGSGDTNDFTVEVNQSDTLTLTGETSAGEVTAESSITVEEIDNYSDRASEIEDRVSELRVDNTDPSLDGQLTDLTLQAENIRTQWDNGNYDQARQTFEEAQSTLNELETEIESQQTSDGDDSTRNETDTDENQDESGGLPIIPIVAIVIVLLLVGGFIFFESYIPEEGDPLYGVFN
jgi:uncharacterized cupredoxin-like copper-binding protein